MQDDENIQFSKKCYYICIGICVIWGIVCIVLKILHISIKEINPYPCFLYSICGLYCPGCGGTRAVEALMNGQIIKSCYYHFAVPYTACLMFVYIISHTLCIISKGKIRAMMFRPIYFYILIAIILIQCFFRNILVLMYGIYILN